MTKKELLLALEQIKDDDEITVFYYHNGDSALDCVISACVNGSSLQLNCRSAVEDDPQWCDGNKDLN